MARTDRSFSEFEQDIERRKAGLAPPQDGAVFYTNGARAEAEAHIEERRAAGQPATTLEQTEYGRRLDGELEPYWKRSQTRNAVALPAASLASKHYAERASGRVEVFCNGERPREDGVFATVERDALIHNERVTHINGQRREDLQAELERDPEQGRARIDEAIRQGDVDRDRRLARDDAKPDPWGDQRSASRDAASPDPWGDDGSRKAEAGRTRTR